MIRCFCWCHHVGWCAPQALVCRSCCQMVLPGRVYLYHGCIRLYNHISTILEGVNLDSFIVVEIRWRIHFRIYWRICWYKLIKFAPTINLYRYYASVLLLLRLLCCRLVVSCNFVDNCLVSRFICKTTVLFKLHNNDCATFWMVFCLIGTRKCCNTLCVWFTLIHLLLSSY